MVQTEIANYEILLGRKYTSHLKMFYRRLCNLRKRRRLLQSGAITTWRSYWALWKFYTPPSLTNLFEPSLRTDCELSDVSW